MQIKFVKTLALSLLVTLFIIGCTREDKNTSGNKARLQVALTDDPGDYEAVFIDVEDIKINYSDDPNDGWLSLADVNRGEYDLLKLVNDDDTILADAEVGPGTISQIRLVLGEDNFVQIDGQKIKLETPSAQQSGLKLNIHQAVEPGLMYKLLMDFDVAKSIVKTGSGKYMLKPVIRTVMEAAGGTIKGNVKPFSFPTAVLVFKGPNDTVASTYSATDNGGYMVRGLGAGTYSLHFLPTDITFQDTVITGINVTTGAITIVDTTRLQQ
ncbi:MAG TPA: DUF4382 domain-containing protein [Chitinophagaceae bacterium]